MQKIISEKDISKYDGRAKVINPDIKDPNYLFSICGVDYFINPIIKEK